MRPVPCRLLDNNKSPGRKVKELDLSHAASQKAQALMEEGMAELDRAEQEGASPTYLLRQRFFLSLSPCRRDLFAGTGSFGLECLSRSAKSVCFVEKEKIAFINGAYGAVAKLKSHHKSEVRKQFLHDDNWVEPYYIERYYSIADEYLAEEIGYNIKIIALHIDAFYTNSDNIFIPVMQALRIVSLIQDGQNDAANLRLLRSQQKYKN